ncbi:MAG: DUF1573 domain-containing protein [Planctomycetota bacterium]|jgi:hypothetical protein
MLFRLLRPLCVISALLGLGTVSQASAQSLVAKPAALDFGDIYDGEAAMGEVTLTNAGETDWAVQQVKTSCGCTVATVHGPDGAEVPSRPRTDRLPVVTLKPGESMTVGVELTTANQHGSVEKQLQIYPIDTSINTVNVPVRARVTKAFAISPPNLNLQTISKSEAIDRIITVQAQSVGEWTIDGFTNAIEGQPLPEALNFEVLDEEGPSRRVRMTTSGGLSVGTLTTKVRVKIGHERVSFVDFYIYGMVEADVRFDTGSETTPGSLSFDKIEVGSKVTRTITITNHDTDNPYVLESADIQSPDPEFFETTIRTLEEGISYEVDVTVDGALGEGFFRGNLVLRAQHTDVPTRSISYHGWVRKS